MTTSILLVGVGGQGTLLASQLLGAVLLRQGHDVKVSEVHGMSQRGGSVVTYVRFGRAVASPLIDEGEADRMVAFELLEAARWLPYLKPGGKVIANTQQLNPMPVITGAAEYPQNLANKIRAQGIELQTLDADALAVQAGSPKATNVVLLGALAQALDVPPAAWEDAIRSLVKPAFVDLNLKAFWLGSSVTCESR